MRLRILLPAVLLVATAACSTSSSKSAPKSTTTSASGGTKTTQTDALFVVNAKAGTATTPAKGTFPLQLTGLDHDAVFFTDRPARDSGIVAVDRMLDMLAKGHQGPPNGAVEVQDGTRGPVVAAVELNDPHYDQAAGTLTAQARILPKTTGPHLHHYDARLASQLPATFQEAALFIDTAVTTVSVAHPSSSGSTTSTKASAPPAPGVTTNTTGPSPFGSTNFCGQQVQASNVTATLTGTSKWSTDVWNPAPPNSGYQMTNGNNLMFESDGGFARGCGNTSSWQTSDGVTFNTSITDPYTGSNSITCSSSDSIFHPCTVGTNSTLRGDNIMVYFYFCDLRVGKCPGQ